MNMVEAHARPLLKQIHALNVYQVNILQILKFMQKVKNTTIPRVFLNNFKESEHNRFSKYNFKQPPAFINYAKISISYWGLQISNKILSETEKNISTLLIFKN